MYYRLIITCTSLMLIISPVLGYEARNLLSSSWDAEKLSGVIQDPEDWSPYPGIDERIDWEKIPEDLRKACIKAGEEALEFDWPNLPATAFMEFHLVGDRANFQGLQNSRRHALSSLVLAEMIENRGRFLPGIINGIWVTCEETYWGVPAHLSLQAAGSGLPDVEEPTVDLFAAETGAQLAWINFLLKPKLEEYHPMISRRIDYEIKRRILDPCLERNDFWWMGFEADRTVNNWNPWINSNWITCILLSEKDPERKYRALAKAMASTDEFINGYPDDGGCDEGPSYWGHAGGSLFDCLDLLYMASGGRIDLFPNPLIRNIGEYILKVHISGSWFINFADASARTASYPAVIYRYGQRIENPELMSFASYLASQSSYSGEAPGGYLSRRLRRIFTIGDLHSAGSSPPLLRDTWLPDLQVFAARDKSGTSEGFYLAGKGGNNAESHNHNDVGNFIIYLNGNPAIIDAGVETYTRKTFSDRRYEIWTMQSSFHNLPEVNGTMQKAGPQFKASEVHYRGGEDRVSFALQLAGAYPDQARLKSLQRELVFERGQRIVLTDRFQLQEAAGRYALNLLAAVEPRLEKPGTILLEEAGLAISYPGERVSPAIEPILITDRRLKNSWGEKIYRIVLEVDDAGLKGEYQVEFKKAD